MTNPSSIGRLWSTGAGVILALFAPFAVRAAAQVRSTGIRPHTGLTLSIEGVGPEAGDGGIYSHTPFAIVRAASNYAGSGILQILEGGAPVSEALSVTFTAGTQTFTVPLLALADGGHAFTARLTTSSRVYTSGAESAATRGTRGFLHPDHPNPYWNSALYGGARRLSSDDLHTIRLAELSHMTSRGVLSRGRQAGVRLNTMNGSIAVTLCPLAIPAVGMDFRLLIDYASNSSFRGSFGAGFSCLFDCRLVPVRGKKDLILVGIGSVDGVFESSDGAVFMSPSGFFGTLEWSGGEYVYTEPGDLKLVFDERGWLAAYRGPAGNQMTIERDSVGYVSSVLDTHGRRITFGYDSPSASHLLKKIVTVVDFTGREVTFTYDSRDNLTSYTLPGVIGTPTGNDFPAGKTTTLDWTGGSSDDHLNHNLATVTDPEASEAKVVLAFYPTLDRGDPSFDRVLSVRVGNQSGTVGGTHSFVYGASPQPQTDWYDRRGVRHNYQFDSSGFLTSLTEYTNLETRPGEQDYTTTYAHNADLLVSSITFPRGNGIQYVYDSAAPGRGVPRSRGNLLFRIRSAGSVGSETDLIEAFTYEPIRNQVSTFTDPRAFPTGETSGFDPDVAPWSRHTTRHFHDYQEGAGYQAARGIPPGERVAEGLGDLNDDGIISQTQGSLVRTTGPMILGQGGTSVPTISGDEGGSNPYSYSNLGDILIEKVQWNQNGQRIVEIAPDGARRLFGYHTTGDRTHYLASLVEDQGGLALTTSYQPDAVGNILVVTDPKGQSESSVYNELNQAVRHLSRPPFNGDTPQNDLTVRYRTDRIYDARDNTVRIEMTNLDEWGVSLPHGLIVNSTAYDLLDCVVTATEDQSPEAGPDLYVTTQYVHDASENLVARIDPEGSIRTTSYDERGLVHRRVVDDNDTDASNGSTHAGASVLTRDYDGNRNLVQVTDAADNGPYDAMGGSDGTAESLLLTYDGFDRETERLFPYDTTQTKIYDLADRVIEVISSGFIDHTPAGGTDPAVVTLDHARHYYDEAGRLFLSERLRYDPHTELPVDGVWGAIRSVFHEDSLLLAREDNNGVDTRYFYDGANRLVQVRDNLGNRVDTAYDANSNPITIVETESSSDLGTPPDVYRTANSYDGLDRLISVIGRNTDDPASGFTVDSWYDSRSNLAVSHDALRHAPFNAYPGNRTDYEYDAAGRMLGVARQISSDGLGLHGGNSVVDTQVIGRSFDRNGRLVGQTDDNGNTTTYGYDNHDRRVSIQFADGTSNVFSFDADDHMISRTDALGTVVDYRHDDVYRSMRTDVVPSPGTVGSTFELLGFDGAGRLVHAENNDGDSTDDILDGGRGNLLELHLDTYDNSVVERENWDNQGFLEFTREFDDVGNLIGLTIPSGLVYAYIMDDLNRTASFTNNSAFWGEWHYKGPRRLERRIYYDNPTWSDFTAPGGTTDYRYDAAGRPVGIDHLADLALADPTYHADFALEYGYDESGNRLFEKATSSGSYEALRSRVFTYDSLHRMIRADYEPDLSGVSEGDRIDPTSFYASSSTHEAFGLDGVGNRTTVSDPVEVTTYAMDGSNPPSDFQVNQYTRTTSPSTEGDKDYTYDAKGNRLNAVTKVPASEDRVEAWEYDFKNRLISYHRSGGGRPEIIEHYEYDALDRRIKRRRDVTTALTGGKQPPQIRRAAPVSARSGAGGQRRRTPLYGEGAIIYFYWDGSLLTELRGETLGQVAIYSHAHGVVGIPGGNAAPFHTFGVTDYVGELGYHHAVWEDAGGSVLATSVENYNGLVRELNYYQAHGEPNTRFLYWNGSGWQYDPWLEDEDLYSWNQFLFAGEWQDAVPGTYRSEGRSYDPGAGRYLNQAPFVGFGSWWQDLNRAICKNDSPALEAEALVYGPPAPPVVYGPPAPRAEDSAPVRSTPSRSPATRDETGPPHPELVKLIERLEGHDVEILTVQGEADVLPAGGNDDTDWVPVKKGMIIPQGSTIQTYENSSVSLRIENASITVQQETKVEVDGTYIWRKLSKIVTDLRVATGNIKVKVHESEVSTDMKIVTPVPTGSVTG